MSKQAFLATFDIFRLGVLLAGLLVATGGLVALVHHARGHATPGRSPALAGGS